VRKLKVFLVNHWVKVLIILVCILLVILTIYGLSTLEIFLPQPYDRADTAPAPAYWFKRRDLRIFLHGHVPRRFPAA